MATQDPKRARALNVADKSVRVQRYQQATVAQAVQLMASLGVTDPSKLNPHLLRKRVSPSIVRTYGEIYEWLAPGQLLDDPPAGWAHDLSVASADSFTPA